MDDMERANLLLDIIAKASNSLGPPAAALICEAREELDHIIEGCKQMKADRDTEAKTAADAAYAKQLAADEANNAPDETPVLAVEELPPPSDSPEVERRI